MDDFTITNIKVEYHRSEHLYGGWTLFQVEGFASDVDAIPSERRQAQGPLIPREIGQMRDSVTYEWFLTWFTYDGERFSATWEIR
jgi:hypothetical protein